MSRREQIQPKSSSGGINAKYIVTTNGSNLHVRTGSSTSHTIIGKMPDKTVVTSGLEESNGWLKHNHLGKIGWSSLTYLKKEETKEEPKKETTSSTSNNAEDSILEGTVSINNPYANLLAKKGVKLEGLGSKLNGIYYIEEVVHTFNNSGYSQSLKVNREWKGESIKNSTPTPPPKPPTSTKPPVTPPKEVKTYTVKKGDTLWAIASKYYGNGSAYTKIFDANKDKLKNPNLIYPGQVLTIP